MPQGEIVTGLVLEEASLTVEEVARACGADAQWVAEHVEAGILTCTAREPAPRFASRDLQRARRVLELERVFEADPELAAMVADLIDEVDRLRARLRRAGLSVD